METILTPDTENFLHQEFSKKNSSSQVKKFHHVYLSSNPKPHNFHLSIPFHRKKANFPFYTTPKPNLIFCQRKALFPINITFNSSLFDEINLSGFVIRVCPTFVEEKLKCSTISACPNHSKVLFANRVSNAETQICDEENPVAQSVFELDVRDVSYERVQLPHGSSQITAVFPLSSCKLWSDDVTSNGVATPFKLEKDDVTDASITSHQQLGCTIFVAIKSYNSCSQCFRERSERTELLFTLEEMRSMMSQHYYVMGSDRIQFRCCASPQRDKDGFFPGDDLVDWVTKELYEDTAGSAINNTDVYNNNNNNNDKLDEPIDDATNNNNGVMSGVEDCSSRNLLDKSPLVKESLKADKISHRFRLGCSTNASSSCSVSATRLSLKRNSRRKLWKSECTAGRTGATSTNLCCPSPESPTFHINNSRYRMFLIEEPYWRMIEHIPVNRSANNDLEKKILFSNVQKNCAKNLSKHWQEIYNSSMLPSASSKEETRETSPSLFSQIP